MEFKISNKYLELTVSSHGAEKQALVSKETNINYLRDVDNYWNRKAPLLFPIVGKLRDLKTFINNKEYSMNQHGFVRDQEFELYSQTESEIVLVNKFNEETLRKYPFEYQVFVKYTLVENEDWTKLFIKTGVLSTTIDEINLYRIYDIQIINEQLYDLGEELLTN